MRKLVYISSPLFGDAKRDHSLAWHACRMAMARGNTPFSSHLLYSQMLDCNDPAQRELETRLNGQMLSLCDELWLCGDVISPGMAADEQLAKEQDIPVKYVSMEEMTFRPPDEQAWEEWTEESPWPSMTTIC